MVICYTFFMQRGWILFCVFTGCAIPLCREEGIRLFHEGKYSEAIEAITECMESHPNDHNLYLFRGCAYYYLEKEEKALEDFMKAWMLDTTDVTPLVYVIKIYSKRKDYENAVKLCNRALKNSQAVSLYKLRGNILMEEGKTEEGIRDLLMYIELNGDEISGFEKAKILSWAGRFDEALKEAKDDYTKGFVFLWMGVPESAYVCWERWLRKYESEVVAHNLAVTCYYMGDVEKMKKVIEEYQGVFNEKFVKYGIQALLSFAEGDYRNSLKYYNLAIEKRPDVAGFYARRGDVRFLLGDEKGAYEDWLKAHRLNPCYPVVRRKK
ncbi:hypothetical protein DRQ18_00900 [bacterium]|nr:MAG: hypothetical protein DRQ18_00900 [bacterium]